MGVSKLRVILAPSAISDLHAIWTYNAKRYGKHHADQYEEFLRQNIEGLSEGYQFASSVDGFPEFRRVVLKKSSRGDGHVVIFEILEVIAVLHLFHTKMDIPARLAEDSDPESAD